VAVIVRLLCQNKNPMRYQNRDYVCNGRDHSTWKCVPTYRWVDGKIERIGEITTVLPRGSKVRT